jgi:hypothetical protein
VAISVYPIPTQKIIDISHQAVHDGSSYSTEHEFTGVGAGATAEMLIVVSANEALHFDYRLSAENDCRIEIFEAPTATPGTAKTIYNQNRSSTNTTDATITHTPTGVTAGSTVIHRRIFFGSFSSGGVSANSGSSARAPEIILKKSTSYLVRLTNNAGTAQDFHIELSYYEV